MSLRFQSRASGCFKAKSSERGLRERDTPSCGSKLNQCGAVESVIILLGPRGVRHVDAQPQPHERSAWALGFGEMSEPFRFGGTKVTTDFPCEMIVDLGVSRHRAALVQRRVMPPRVPRAFAQQSTTMSSEVRQQIAALHTAI